jgi:hypothetical protein
MGEELKMAKNELNLYEKIIAVYPELVELNDLFFNGTIQLQNDSDGAGDYVLAWNYEKPLPEGLKLGK